MRNARPDGMKRGEVWRGPHGGLSAGFSF